MVKSTLNKKIYLGAGCFWCTEAVFQRVQGTLNVISGYMGGTKEDANYERVCSGKTKHVEVIELVYDPKILCLKKILDIFFKIHDATQINRQGNDVGPQYHSTIFYDQEEDLKEITNYVKTLSFEAKTTISKSKKFYEAEKYHQNYYELNKDSNPYCYFVIKPKLQKL